MTSIQWRALGARLLSLAPATAFVLTLMMAAYGLGHYSAANQRLMFGFVEEVFKTKDLILNHFLSRHTSDFMEYSKIPAGQVQASRVTAVAPSDETANFLITGGPQRFLDYCPAHGCLAVVLDRKGKLVHAYPFRPDEYRTGHPVDLPYQQPFMDLGMDLSPFGFVPLPGGDLIVTFFNDRAFPYGAGVARVAPDGHVIWYRRDYTHHWPAVLPTGEIAVLSNDVSTKPVWRPTGAGHLFSTGCRSGYYRDTLLLLDMNGRQLREFKLMDALLDSRWRALLTPSGHPFSKIPDSCDPLHTNYVRMVGPEIAAKLPGVAADDFLVSIRNIDTIGILQRRTGKFIHMLRGSFHLQHSAQPIEGGRVLVFDDLGASSSAGPSRVIAIDAGTGQETTLFPGPATPPGTPMYTTIAGNVDVSPDHKRMLVAVTESGIGYEVDVATGKILTRFENLHDVRPLKLDKGRSAMAVRFKLSAIYYMPTRH